MQFLKSVDTFYFYLKIDYEQVSLSTLSNFIGNMIDDCVDTYGVSYGRSWFELDGFGRVGIMSYDDAIKSNTHQVLFQLSFNSVKQINPDNFLNDFNNLIYDFLIQYGIELINPDFLIQRYDLNYTFHKQNFKIPDCALSKFRSKSLYHSDNNDVETFYLGKRSNGLTVRFYNKTKEMLSRSDFSKMDYYNQIFNTYFDLYTIEIEAHRKFLTSFEEFKDANVNDIAKITNMLDVRLHEISYYQGTDKNLKNLKDNHRDRIDISFNLSTLTNFNGFRKYPKINYKDNPSIDYIASISSNKYLNYNKKMTNKLHIDDYLAIIKKQIEQKELFKYENLDLKDEDFKEEKKNAKNKLF